ncbi:MAG: tripartite tricarboxylate transporter substrate binding protein [Betaproteobacteria bacterium]|nr:tripartite tricarboxylate transporter substrate binding protein [Betaproteobacteria bacterium]
MSLHAARWFAGALLCAAVAAVSAQPFPNKAIRVVVPYPPGGFNDVVTRVLVQGFNDGFAPGSYADNKPGAGTVIGTELVARSSPDGYTVLVVSFPFSVMNALYPASKVDVVKDFAALNYVGYAPSLLVANSAMPYKTVRELIAAAKAKPATLLYASTSNGSSAHLFMELFKSLTETSLVHVPYKGNGPAMIDLLGGQVPIMFANLPNGLPHVQSGKLRALAVTAPKRIEVLPEVQTMSEAGVNGFEANTWWGAVAPAATPKDVVARLNTEINRILGTAEVRKLFQSQDVQIAGGTTEACAEYIRSQVALWSKVVREAKIKAE